MGRAYYYNPGKQPPKKLRYTPKHDGRDWQRELCAVFCGTLVPPEKWKPEWIELHKQFETAKDGFSVNPER
nr:hypothetical protein [Leptospira noguchii]